MCGVVDRSRVLGRKGAGVGVLPLYHVPLLWGTLKKNHNGEERHLDYFVWAQFRDIHQASASKGLSSLGLA